LTLQYVNCFYDFQEPYITHPSPTKQQRRSRDLNVETKTSSKSPRVENLQILSKCFEKFSKQYHHQLRSRQFSNCRHFSCLFTVCYFLPARTTDKNYFNFEVVEL